MQCRCQGDINQVSLFATITTSTPQAVAAILADTGHDPTAAGTRQPSALATTACVYPLAQPPMGVIFLPDHGKQRLSGALGGNQAPTRGIRSAIVSRITGALACSSSSRVEEP